MAVRSGDDRQVCLRLLQRHASARRAIIGIYFPPIPWPMASGGGRWWRIMLEHWQEDIAELLDGLGSHNGLTGGRWDCPANGGECVRCLDDRLFRIGDPWCGAVHWIKSPSVRYTIPTCRNAGINNVSKPGQHSMHQFCVVPSWHGPSDPHKLNLWYPMVQAAFCCSQIFR